MNHTITISWHGRFGELLAECSCGTYAEYWGESATLVKMNEAAHEHITAAERATWTEAEKEVGMRWADYERRMI